MELKRRKHDLFEVVRLVFGAMTDQLNKEEKESYNRMMEDEELLNNRELLSDPHAIISELNKSGCFDTAGAYRQFRLRTGKSGKLRRISLGWVAASLLIPIGIAVGVLLLRPVEQPIPEEPEGMLPITSAAWLKLSDGRRIGLGNLQDTLLEHDGTRIANEGGVLNYQSGHKGGDQLVYNELTVPRGGEYMLQLPDGTQVWLNSESILKYPLHFSGTAREVFLSGEAYFSVTRDVQKPFKVHTSYGEVKVLGTEFNVRNYPEEESVVTTLVKGRVLYRNKDNYSRMAELSPGLQVTDKTGMKELELKRVDISEFVGWRDGLYVFRNLTLEQIMNTVARNYDAEIHWDSEEIKGYRFSGDLKKYEYVDKFLNFIEVGGDVHFTIKGKMIFVGKK